MWYDRTSITNSGVRCKQCKVVSTYIGGLLLCVVDAINMCTLLHVCAFTLKTFPISGVR